MLCHFIRVFYKMCIGSNCWLRLPFALHCTRSLDSHCWTHLWPHSTTLCWRLKRFECFLQLLLIVYHRASEAQAKRCLLSKLLHSTTSVQKSFGVPDPAIQPQNMTLIGWLVLTPLYTVTRHNWFNMWIDGPKTLQKEFFFFQTDVSVPQAENTSYKGPQFSLSLLPLAALHKLLRRFTDLDVEGNLANKSY